MVHPVVVRADARRNRDRILASARALVSGTGVDATMDDIARHAGVAVGTLYRHFPAKEDLVAAVVDDSAERMAVLTEDALAAVSAGAPPGRELAALFRAVAEQYATDRVFKAAAGRLDDAAAVTVPASPPDDPLPHSAAERAKRAITALLDRAREAGAVRADVTLADLVLLLGSVPDAGVPRALRDRYVDIVLAGLAAGSDP